MTTEPTTGGPRPPMPEDTGRPFYVTGGTLPPSASSYVKRAADAALLSALRRGEFCYVLNTRQMGKSSLMARTADLLRQSGSRVVALDLTGLGQNLSVTQWYNGLLEGVSEQLGLERELWDYAKRCADAGPMQRFLRALREVALPAASGALVVFIDEVDAVRSLPFSTDELFAGIREFYNRRTLDPELERLTFCLLGVATPADLIRDTRTTPFNIGARIDLTDFTPSEAAPLAQGMVGSQAVLDRVLHWTGGHPYLTQRLCRTIAEEPHTIMPSDVDALCERLFLSHRARDTEDNLLFVRDRILRSGLDLVALLSLYDHVVRGRPAVRDDPADPLVSALKLAGVVKADVRGRLVVRNRIYARVFGRAWVAENMPGAEVRRQKRAFRRGALRVGLVSAVIIAIIGTLAGYAVKEAREAQQQSARFERLLYVSDMQNAQAAWDDGNLGRLRALLAQTKDSRERGWEWGYWNHLAYPSGDAVQVGAAPLVACDATKDGTKLLTAGGDGLLRIWDARTLRQLYSVRYPGPALVGAAFSTDGSHWQADDDAGGLAIYETVSGKRLVSLPADQSGVTYLASPDLDIALRCVSDGGATFINMATGRKYGFLPSRGRANGASAVAHTHDKVYWFNPKPLDASIYDMTTGRRICRLQLPPRLQSPITIFGAFSNDDRTLVTLNWPTNDYNLWDAASGRLIRHLDNIPFAHTWFFQTDPYAPILLLRDNDRLRTYSTQTGQRLLNCSYPETSGELSPRAFSRDGRYLTFVGATGAIFLLDCKTGKSAGTYLGHTAASTDTAFLPHDDRFISVSADGSLRRWNKGDAAQNHWSMVRFPPNVMHDYMRMFKHQSRAVLWEWERNSPVRNSLWSITADHAQRMRDLEIGPRHVFQNANETTVTLTPETGGAYTEYDLIDGHVIGSWKGGDAHTGVAAVSSDGRYLAAFSASGMTSLFDMQSNARVWSARGSNSDMNGLVFSPSGSLVAGGGSERVIDVWDARNGRKVASLSGSTGAIQSVIILRGDKHLAAACADQTLRCWDIASGRLLWAVQCPQNAWPFNLRQSPDGKRLLMTSQSGIVSLWDAETGDLLLKMKAKGSLPDARFSSDGGTLEMTNTAGRYINYVADMHPHDAPAPKGGQ